MSDEEEEMFKAAQDCHICEQQYGDNDVRVRDHCHILLLADVFENLRETCLLYYKLDPAHYFTSPGLSWDVIMKMPGIRLELTTDVDMLQFFEKGMRGGISYILVSKPTYVNSKIFNEDLVAVHKIRETLILDRPVYVGLCILDLSKTLMYDFHYNYIKEKYGK